MTQYVPEGYSNYNALQTAITKRMSQNWQGSATYTLSMLKQGNLTPAGVTVPLAPDLGAQYALGAGDQRHRAVFNGIWQLQVRPAGERHLLLRIGRAAVDDLRQRRPR